MKEADLLFRRYAIYFTPAPGPLADFGAGWLGWDPVSGETIAHPHLPDLPAPIPELTQAPARYGLHATMKPPFRLALTETEVSLRMGFQSFCARTPPVALDGLCLARLGRFIALRPEGDQETLNVLAASTVREFERFRAPLDSAELARRRAVGLTQEQDRLLTNWGYPFVMEAFRFHITLTGDLEKRLAMQVEPVLAAQLAPLLPRPFHIDALSLMGEDTQGHFHLIHRHRLCG